MTIPEELAPAWIVGQRDELAEMRLQKELGINSLVAAVLVQRGYREPAAADKFLNPRLDDLHAPELLPDYRAAADAILGAKERGETIYVHGDYDVDGVTSAALFTRFLTRLGVKVIPHVPHRMKEGYGIHMDAIGWAKEQGADLFLTCDCGANAHQQLEAVRDAGMLAVVTDHHELGGEIPHALAVVNPHRKDSTYPFPHLSGVGVALKVCAGISAELGLKVEAFYRAFLDLAVMGTVADVMPLIGENRIITKFGLENLRNTKKAGLRALLSVSELATPETVLTPRSIGFQLAPRINAVGRIDDSGVALDLLLTEDFNEAMVYARRLDQLNQERRLEQGRMFDEAVVTIEDEQLGSRNVIVVSRPTWHPGIIGIVAGKLVEKYRRPAFVVAVGADGIGKGSARSIPGFHLADALAAHREMILGGGGHELAAGFSLESAQLRAFSDGLHTYAGSILGPEDFAKKIKMDLEIAACEGTRGTVEAMRSVEPYGEGNAEPVFLCQGVELGQVQATSKPEHVRLSLHKDGQRFDAMAFGIGNEVSAVPTKSRIDVACTFELKTYRGQEQFRWIVRDFRMSETSD